MGYRIAIDVGGTFTDVVVADDAGRLTIGKGLTTKERIFRFCRKFSAEEFFAMFLHGE